MVGRQWDAIRSYTMHADMLAGEDSGTGRHADRALIASLVVDNAALRQAVYYWRLGDCSTCATE